NLPGLVEKRGPDDNMIYVLKIHQKSVIGIDERGQHRIFY
ncbi:hypothetical protein Tco_1387533, partial [Tanacetum coccineum]